MHRYHRTAVLFGIVSLSLSLAACALELDDTAALEPPTETLSDNGAAEYDTAAMEPPTEQVSIADGEQMPTVEGRVVESLDESLVVGDKSLASPEIGTESHCPSGWQRSWKSSHCWDTACNTLINGHYYKQKIYRLAVDYQEMPPCTFECPGTGDPAYIEGPIFCY
ncbi:hypothetical protein [Haliangium sp.]|uniref:hypothetical protein n=1 Tax=Haliangium sp. TaxID=2663208 RepID=UPI003D12ACB9